MERKPDRRVIVRGRRTTDKGVCAFHDLNVGEVSDIKTDLKETVEKVRNKIDELKGLLAEKSNKEELEVVKKEQKAYLPRIYFFSFITAFVVIGITWFEYNSSQNEKMSAEFDRQMKPGAYAYSGNIVDLLKDSLLILDSGVIILTGQDVVFTYSGEFIPSGKLEIVFNFKSPTISCGINKPEISFGINKPNISFEIK